MIKTKFFWIFTLFSLYLKFARANDDDDDDILFDFAIGFAIGLCETSAACAPILPLIFIICLSLIIVVCIFGSAEDRRGLIPSGKQVFANGGGYWAGRMVGR